MSDYSPSFKRAILRQARDTVINVGISSGVVPRGLRWRLLRTVGIDSKRATINAGHFFGGRDLSIGEGVFANYELFIDTAARVTIGDRVSFGPRVTIITGTHELGSAVRRAGAPRALPVTIGEGTWIGASVTILPGVTIGPGCVIAAGAVVTGDIPSNALAAGAPATVKRQLEH